MPESERHSDSMMSLPQALSNFEQFVLEQSFIGVSKNFPHGKSQMGKSAGENGALKSNEFNGYGPPKSCTQIESIASAVPNN